MLEDATINNTRGEVLCSFSSLYSYNSEGQIVYSNLKSATQVTKTYVHAVSHVQSFVLHTFLP